MRNFLRSSDGNIAVLFAIVAVVLIGAGGVAFDYTRWTAQRSALQEAADAGAIAGAVELGLGGQGVVNRARQKAERMTAANQAPDIAAAAPVVTVDQAAGRVTVDLAMTAQKTFSGALMAQDKTLAVASTAEIVNKSVACIYALNGTAAAALNGNGSAILLGTNCAIQVNSDDPAALTNSGTITASHICVVGGYSGGGYTPAPETGCAPVADPFLATTIPAPGGCTANNLTINVDTSLGPGVYCGGIMVNGGATLTLSPGEYHIVDGPLKATAGGSITGAEVVFILSGTGSLDIAGNGQVTTTPPTSGGLAGYSIVQDRNAPLGGVSKITGEGRFEFPGIIYLPRQALDVAGRAAGNVFVPTYAAIVADTIKVSGQGELNATADTSNFGKKASAALTVVNTRLIR